MQLKKFDVVVIGGGAAGMLAAGAAGSTGKSVLLIEKNEKLGKKLFITGKGRCNITNNADINEFYQYIPRNPKFLYSSFSMFSNSDLLMLLESLGLKTKEERGGRVFPLSDKSSDVIKALCKYLHENNVSILLDTSVNKINTEDEKIVSVQLNDNSLVYCNSAIICTGGMSYPQTGSTGDGYKLASQLGHTITDIAPSLVPLLAKEDTIKDLQGLSLKNISISVIANDRIIYKDFGEMLFTHYGLSGPIILSSSFYITEYLKKKETIKISIDLKPALSKEDLDKRIVKDFEKNSRKQYKNSLDELLPKKLIPVIIRLSSINEEKEVNQITKEERTRLVDLLKNFEFTITGTRPVSEAIITSGGVNIKEINPKTMESKIISGLFFAGEILDIDAFTGGFNLQIAFSTGYNAGINS